MKIGFVAMSGVRAHNEELTQLGLTLPGFVERNKIIASMPSLGLLTLAGLTPDKFEIEYHEIADLRQHGELPDGFDLVALSTFTAQLKEAYEVADIYRNKNIPVVMGGISVSSLPDEAKKHCTSVVVGEGEPLWRQVLADFERGDLKPFYVQSPRGGFDLRDAPMPRFDLLDPDKYNRITIQTSRGCPHKCEFCASSILLTPKYKLKPVEKVIAEIHEIKKIWPRPFIEFADDNSFVNTAHYKQRLRALAKEKLLWFTEADINVAKDDELLGLMRDSGMQIYIHIVFAVEGRQNLIKAEHNDELQKYITGIVSGQKQKLIAINNLPDHLHLLVGLKPDLSLSELVRDVKANSSKFINEKRWVAGRFSWQEGFGAFSYSRSQLDTVIRYIQDQQKPHARKSFREEYVALLERFHVEYDPRFIFHASDE